eukprot:GGOE01043450.1.p1 GENE.GGOE01043450.1~~GGOE01043450.1.p1  ORF type:complete len:718 (+),score=184.31 GGOE01043450.1:228-2156(+)
MAPLLFNPEMSNVRFLVGPDRVEIPAHRLVLAGQSEVLSRMLQSEFAENNESTIELPDVDVAVLKAFLELLYCGMLSAKAEVLLPLFALCHLYQAQQPMDAIAAALAAGIAIDSVFHIFHLGFLYNIHPLRDHAVAFLRSNSATVVRSILAGQQPAFQDCTVEELHELLGDDQLVADEEDIWKVLLAWAQARQAGGSEPLIDLMAPLLPDIRWSLMSTEALRRVQSSKVVPADVLLPFALGDPLATRYKPRAFAKTVESFVLRSAPNLSHRLYHWRLTAQDLQAGRTIHSPPVEVGGITLRAAANNTNERLNMNFTVVDPKPDSDAVAFFTCSALRSQAGAVYVDFSCGRHVVAWRDAPNFLCGQSNFLDLSRCWMDPHCLHGPAGDLLFALEFQVKRPFRMERARKVMRDGHQEEVFILTLPALALCKRLTHQFVACDQRWEMKLRPKQGATILDVKHLSSSKKSCYAFLAYLQHPSNPSLSDASRRHTMVRSEMESHLRWVWSEQPVEGIPTMADFTDEEGAVTIRFSINEAGDLEYGPDDSRANGTAEGEEGNGFSDSEGEEFDDDDDDSFSSDSGPEHVARALEPAVPPTPPVCCCTHNPMHPFQQLYAAPPYANPPLANQPYANQYAPPPFPNFPYP